MRNFKLARRASVPSQTERKTARQPFGASFLFQSLPNLVTEPEIRPTWSAGVIYGNVSAIRFVTCST